MTFFEFASIGDLKLCFRFDLLIGVLSPWEHTLRTGVRGMSPEGGAVVTGSCDRIVVLQPDTFTMGSHFLGTENFPRPDFDRPHALFFYKARREW